MLKSQREKIYLIAGSVFMIFLFYQIYIGLTETPLADIMPYEIYQGLTEDAPSREAMIEDFKNHREKFESIVQYGKTINQGFLIEKTWLGYTFKTFTLGTGFQKATVDDMQVHQNIMFIIQQLDYQGIGCDPDRGGGFAKRQRQYHEIVYSPKYYKDQHPDWLEYETIEENWFFRSYKPSWKRDQK